MAGLGFGDLLDMLGHDGYTSVCNKPPGGEFRSQVVPSAVAPVVVPATGDVWFGVNPVKGPARINQGRGTAADVVRLAAVYADLDVKPGGMGSFEAAADVITDLSGMLSTPPVATVFSGHGLQPYWSIENGPAGGEARALLRRFGRLVAHVAEIHGGKVDPVYDLARVLRVPNTTNHKSEPVPVVGSFGKGRPLATGELDEALGLYGAVELAGDRDEGAGTIVSVPASWGWAEETCHYARAMVTAWSDDEPAARHPWLVRQATRVAAAQRYGCWDADGYTAAVNRLAAHFHGLISRGTEARKEAPGEVADAFAWGRDLAGSKTDAQIGAELGNHRHEPLDTLTFAGPPAPEPLLASEEEESPGAAVRRLFPRLDWHELWGTDPGEDWILEPLIAARRGVALFSPAKVGKSLLALEIAVGISKGIRTLGAMPDRAHRVLYIDHENDPLSDVRSRLEDMNYGPDDLGNLHYLSYPTMAPLDTVRGAQEIVAVAQAYDCDIVIVDTISRAVAGEENDNDTWLRLYRLTGLALKQAGIAMLRLDHTGKDEERGMRGGSAKYGDLDAVWKLTKVAEDTYKLMLTDKRFRIAEDELVLTRTIDPLGHKVEGRGWMVAADRRFNELFDHLAKLNVPAKAGRNIARAALKAAGIKATNSELENVLRHRKTCPNWGTLTFDHRTCPISPWAVEGSEE